MPESQSLYVAYRAEQIAPGTIDREQVMAFIILKVWMPPNSTKDVEKLCQKIAVTQNCFNVIPLFWSNLGRG